MAKTIKYQKVNKLSKAHFKRAIGASKDTFSKMQKVLNKHYKERKTKSGTSRSLAPSDEPLLMLECLVCPLFYHKK